MKKKRDKENNSKLHICVNGKEFGFVDLPDSYLIEPKRSELIYEEYPRIVLPEGSLKTLKDFFLNYKDYEGFMRVILSQDEFDCWQYQTQRIYKMFKGDEDENKSN